jgi:hypothetical protein
MLDPTDFDCSDELDGINEDFFLAFNIDVDGAGDALESSAADPDLWDDVPY